MTFSTEGLVVRYRGQSRAALDGVTMEVPAGTLYAVLGPNGSGKTTLMKALLGTVRPEAGLARVEGRTLPEWNRRELARSVGVVSQAESLAFPIRVRELVSMGRYPHLGALQSERPEDRAVVDDALRRCDAEQLADRSVATLSGGEFQRVRIARALAQRPRALALDEPTGSLDIRHEMEIFRLLRESVGGGMTVLLITHHLSLAARFADRILLLHEGRVAAEGTPAEVIREQVLEEVYGWPVAVYPDPITGTPRVTPLEGPPDHRP